MKVLILNGSPRRHGNMSKMLELMKQELEGCGVGTVYIDVPQLQVHPCIGFFHRLQHSLCPILGQTTLQ